jgi:hypothetical protein
MRADPDEHALSVIRLGVFVGITTSTDLPLMQAHVLELYERARAAGRFASWHREREIVAGWMGHLRAQGNSALGAMGAFISFYWEDECQRQAATFNSQPGAS